MLISAVRTYDTEKQLVDTKVMTGLLKSFKAKNIFRFKMSGTDIASRDESNFLMFLRRGRLVLRKSQRKLSEAEG